MPASIESLNPLRKGGSPLTLVLIGVGLAVVGGVALYVAPFITNALDTAGQAVGLPSSVEGAGLLTGEQEISATGSLGVGSHPYSTVTVQANLYGEAGDTYGSFTQYVWEKQPQNWADPLNIDNDYTTPKGTDGAAIPTPLKSTITDSIFSATLTTALAEGDVQMDAAGNIIPVEKTYYVHGSHTGAPDSFFVVKVPSAGAVDATTPTVTLPNLIIPKLDTSTWQSTVLDLEGPSGTATGKEVDALVSYKILDENVTQIRSIKLNDLNKMGDAGNLEEVTIKMKGMNDWTPYDYSSGIDEFEYDGSSGFDATLNGSDVSDDSILATIAGGESVDFEIEVVADYGGANQLGQDIVLTNVTVTDIEGNTLLSQDVNG